jgi:maltooligosyltrehalose trehalohydrolase
MSHAAPLPVLGALPESGATRFGLFCTTAKRCAVRLFAESGEVLGTHPMAPAPPPHRDGHFQVVLPGVGAGALYKFVLDDRELPDPCARFLPQGVHGPAQVLAPAPPRPRRTTPSRPLREHVIYELHIGTFTQAGTYAAAAERLPALVELGITAVELLPIAAFAGQRGWGYDGVALFAPFAPYGTPDALRAFIDRAHGLGLAVLLDAVYNHLGPSGNYLYAYCPEYVTRSLRNAWGDALDYTHPVLRRLILDSALHWLTEFGFDGLRLDATHAIVDPSERQLLAELAERTAELSPCRLLIAEDERNEPKLVSALGLHAIWADDFHHAVHVTLTGEQDGYYAGYPPGPRAIADAISGGWLYAGQPWPLTNEPRGRSADSLPAEAFVYCVQNHDQIGNRAFGERLSALIPIEAYELASALLLFLPMTPLLFMGQEWAASSPLLYFTDHEEELGRAVSRGRLEEFKRFAAFSDPAARERIPDPQDPETFRRSQLRWPEREEGAHRRVLLLYTELLRLRRTDPVLRSATRAGLRAEADGPLLRVHLRSEEGERLLLGNFSPRPLPDASFDPARVLLRTGQAADSAGSHASEKPMDQHGSIGKIESGKSAPGLAGFEAVILRSDP